MLDAIIGGWQVAGVFRLTSGFPVSVTNGIGAPTNYYQRGFAARIGAAPETETTRNAPPISGTPGPNIFPNPAAAFTLYSNPPAGETGTRNDLRGDGYFTIDLGVSKAFRMPWSENQRLAFRWETFNVTNTVRFDPRSLNLSTGSAASFGKYTRTLTNPRVMQFVLRYQF